VGVAARAASVDYFTRFNDGRFGPDGGLGGVGSDGESPALFGAGSPAVGLSVSAVPPLRDAGAPPARRGPRDALTGASALGPSAGSLDVVGSLGIGNAIPCPFSRA
jgi:hypothetical protein